MVGTLGMAPLRECAGDHKNAHFDEAQSSSHGEAGTTDQLNQYCQI